MAKSTKNTLADLNSFLKQKQAETSPQASANEDDFINQKPSTLVEVTRVEDLQKTSANKETPDESAIADQIQALADSRKENLRKVLYKVIEIALEKSSDLNASDVMLQNMIHYLHHTENMAEGIDAYIAGMKK